MTRKRLPTVPDPSAPALPAAVTSTVGFLMREAASRFRVRVERMLFEFHLRPQQLLMLITLRDEGPMSQLALGQRLGMDRTTTMQSAQALADAGYIDRQDDPDDRRVYRLTLTSQGRRLAATLEGRLKKIDQELLAPLSAEDRARFLAQLHAIVDCH
ncbi:MAG: winged helix-turn-helix transcriptional regulator [Gemmatimonadaceae bacterium]|nr:winged helix-turn-helix transcriptional regulator [Gemmatimonadaceae bacterium]